MNRIFPSLALLALLLLTACAADPGQDAKPGEIVGRVVGVTDGDTIAVLSPTKTQYKVRLYGIDAPESRQDFGGRAKQELSGLVFNKDMRVLVMDTDRYGRTVGKVYVGQGDGAVYINRAMIERGMAWWYAEYAPKDTDLQEAEAKAKAAKLGLWGQGTPTPPWQWRRASKASKAGEPGADEEAEPENDTKANATDATANAQPTAPAGLCWLNTGSGVRHNEKCRYFNKTKAGRLCGPDEGKPCGECGG
ncbi:MAG: nuclease [Planctomycetes bacterium]|nr:nuclease [Planctomycetota bacterium]